MRALTASRAPVLLTRDAFRDSVFKRDNYKCVFCDKPGHSAHHIIDRRLWPSGGYYIDNGATVCKEHHIMCETTEISVEDVRYACGISRIIVPEHLYDDQPYDKWANPILPNKKRMIGELFFDESVQKILKQGDKLHLFTETSKYPRTYHVPWSEGISSDDRINKDMSRFYGKRVIVTIKMDGENTSMYCNDIHARSLDSASHLSRDWVKSYWASFAYEIPKRWRICGENLYAKHSIQYNNLPSYFMGFSVWNDHNRCIAWDETMEWFSLLDIVPVQVIYDGIYDEALIKSLWNDNMWSSVEGFVIRVADEFGYGNFRHNVAKFVRKNHVQTTKHWMRGQRLEKNFLAC